MLYRYEVAGDFVAILLFFFPDPPARPPQVVECTCTGLCSRAGAALNAKECTYRVGGNNWKRVRQSRDLQPGDLGGGFFRTGCHEEFKGNHCLLQDILMTLPRPDETADPPALWTDTLNVSSIDRGDTSVEVKIISGRDPLLLNRGRGLDRR